MKTAHTKDHAVAVRFVTFNQKQHIDCLISSSLLVACIASGSFRSGETPMHAYWPGEVTRTEPRLAGTDSNQLGTAIHNKAGSTNNTWAMVALRISVVKPPKPIHLPPHTSTQLLLAIPRVLAKFPRSSTTVLTVISLYLHIQY